MKTRRKSIVRNLLRVVEIALFFAISVLGYGLLAKTSSGSSKTRSRNLPSGIEKNMILGGLQRELPELSATAGHGKDSHPAFEAPGVFRFVSPPMTMLNHPLELLSGYASPDTQHRFATITRPTILPSNLFQQNPVLLM